MDSHEKISGNKSRRAFLKTTGTTLAATAVGMNIGYGATDLSSNKKTLKVGLIGCGGRGTGAAVNAVNADPNVVLTAMGDIFEDHLEKAYAVLKEEEPDKIKVDDSHKFIGFDAYRSEEHTSELQSRGHLVC